MGIDIKRLTEISENRFLKSQEFGEEKKKKNLEKKSSGLAGLRG